MPIHILYYINSIASQDTDDIEIDERTIASKLNTSFFNSLFNDNSDYKIKKDILENQQYLKNRIISFIILYEFILCYIIS
jgi:hypothetical protein